MVKYHRAVHHVGALREPFRLQMFVEIYLNTLHLHRCFLVDLSLDKTDSFDSDTPRL